MITTTESNNWIRILSSESAFVPKIACFVERTKENWWPFERFEVREMLEIWEVAQELGN